MHFDTGLGSSDHLQHVLLVALLTPLAIFAVRLYNARVKFIHLKKQGLVSK